MQRGGVEKPPIVPCEAAAALAMLLLQNHGMLMVHFVGVPPGTADLLIKFVPPETLQRFGGAGRYARAIDDSLTRLGVLLRDPASITGLLLGEGSEGDAAQAQRVADHADGADAHRSTRDHRV
jgi:L-seryl-tRNA(Ser) seleniumtransferase